MLVDQRRSRSDLHRVTVLGSFSVTAHGEPVPLESDARRVVAYLAVHRRPSAVRPGRRPVARRTRRRRPARRVARGRGHARDGRRRRHRRPRPRRGRRPRRGDGPGPRAGHRPRPPRQRARDLPAATALLGADVLPDWTEAWLPVERERFRQIRLNALEELSSALTASGRFADAVVTARAAVHTAPSREGARRALIEAHLAPGRDRRGRRRVRRVPGAAAQQRRRAPAVRVRRGVRPRRPVPPVPAWPVLRVRRHAERVPVAAPGLRTARGTRRLVSGGSVPGTTR